MGRDRRRLAGAAALMLAVSASTAQDKAPSRGILERYPAAIQERLDRAERQRQAQLAKTGVDKLEGVMEAGRLWTPGTTVSVAFRGGTGELCEKLAAVANVWAEHGNLKLSFRTPDGKLRRWSPADKAYAADVRVGFDHPAGGYFSLVGTESRDPKIVPPGEASMNFQGFDHGLPLRWESTVLHEFGHAVGFHHEHQSPVVPCDFRFEDDPGYVPAKNPEGEFEADGHGRRPGLYTRLGGPPNKWSQKDVDDNLGQLKRDSRMFLASGFDRDSIMTYPLEAWMFKGGEKSRCYTGGWKSALSKTDKLMMAKAYPTSAEEIRKLEDAIRQFKALTPDR